MTHQRKCTSGRRQWLLSRKTVLGYVAIYGMWILISTPLIWKFRWHPLILATMRVLYFIILALILYFILHRERVLHNSRSEYHRLLNSMLEPVVIHANGVVLEANLHAVSFLQVESKEELVGKPILSFVHPDYQEAVKSRIARLEEGEGTGLLEEKFVTVRGSVRYVEVSGVPIHFDGRPAILVLFRDTTERKRQGRAIHASERRLRTLINALPDQICFIDMHGRWIEANTTLLNSVGLRADSYRGKTASELAELCEPQFKQIFLRNSQYSTEVLSKETHYYYEYYKPGNIFSAHEISRVPVQRQDGSQLGLVVISQDVSETRLATRRLAESEQRYRSLFDHDEDMIVFLDADGRIGAANPACEKTLGYSSNELVGQHFATFVPHDMKAQAQRRVQEVLTGVTQTRSRTLVHRNGSTVHVHEKKIPVAIDGQVSGMFWTVRDLTAQKVSEELLIKSERLSAVGEMAAGIAHEIRNPLTALKGFVQFMQSSEGSIDSGIQGVRESVGPEPTGTQSIGPESTVIKESYLAVMKDELERIESIVNELLLLAKPTTGYMERCNCTQIVQEVIDLMNPHAFLRDIVIEIKRPDEDAYVLCEKNRIKQVLINLIKNAIEATPGGGEIHVLVEKSTQSNTVSICVRDKGSGMAADVLERIGEPFYTTKGAGTGLGLTISREIVEAHEGIMEIRSEPGIGTEVEIRLPL